MWPILISTGIFILASNAVYLTLVFAAYYRHKPLIPHCSNELAALVLGVLITLLLRRGGF